MFTVSASPRPAPAGRLSGCRVLALAWLLGSPIAAQSPGIPTSPGVPVHRPSMIDPTQNFDSGSGSMEARQAKMLNIERQRVIVADTDRILELARQLNADANSGSSAMTPAERFHKAEEIERLAKAVREKMTNAIGMPPPANPYSVTRQQ